MHMTFQMMSYLLRYPDEDLQAALPDIRDFCTRMKEESVQDSLLTFLDEVEKRDLDQLTDHYIGHFDFGRLTNLYVTYLKLGEQRERGVELLKLKMMYEENGFSLTEKDLPDYLPLMLEFCAHAPEKARTELLQMHGNAIDEIRNKLAEQSSYYAVLLDALFHLMEAQGVEIERQVS
ncbi:nitrate reductase molybdenum cofactor assembly chaperone [Aureibacillus halotolerans]|uniref:Respiratory nitrate reductase chaperone NarJ n=1 Tax=Aureibacillus halotolerans TaxID=1508390 RepID=A0A4R6UCC7_9BACI|nr:nitrate reductase molybdenum cofactor assembly chaperone [Aureibacillus halotolerans]TDQ40734.1 respiratory nitrate reductase chaperone NarJ [Aureibacillus halotolerans]